MKKLTDTQQRALDAAAAGTLRCQDGWGPRSYYIAGVFPIRAGNVRAPTVEALLERDLVRIVRGTSAESGWVRATDAGTALASSASTKREGA